MKVTSVVQDIHKFLQALHPPLPLSTKESLRLHNVLTTAFRKHLDEAYPTSAAERPEHWVSSHPFNSTSSTNSNGDRSRSSAVASADRHMASVLTNPLFMRPPQPRPEVFKADRKPSEDPIAARNDKMHNILSSNLANPGRVAGYRKSPRTQVREKQASAEIAAEWTLKQDPTLTPLDLLERSLSEHPENIILQAANASVLQKSISVLTREQQEDVIVQMRLGQKLLHWLRNYAIEKTSLYFSDMLGFLVRCLVLEGLEKAVWIWLSLRLRVATLTSSIDSDYAVTAWRARLLMSLVTAKLGPAYMGNGSDLKGRRDMESEPLERGKRYDAAIGIVLKASEMELCLDESILGPPFLLLARRLTSAHITPVGVNLEKYDQLVHLVKTTTWSSAKELSIAQMIAALELCRPKQPNADAALHYLRGIYPLNSSGSYAIENTKDKTTSHTPKKSQERYEILFMARAAYILWQQRRQDDAVWVVSMLREKFAGYVWLEHVRRMWLEWHVGRRIFTKEDEAHVSEIIGELPIVEDLARWQRQRTKLSRGSESFLEASLLDQLFLKPI